jgi:hypothetical protein
MAPDELLRYPLVVVGSLALPAQRRDVAGVAGSWVAVSGLCVYTWGAWAAARYPY